MMFPPPKIIIQISRISWGKGDADLVQQLVWVPAFYAVRILHHYGSNETNRFLKHSKTESLTD